MKLQFSSFVVIGLVQYTVDVLAFSLVYLLSGQAVASNIFSRGFAAGLGYYLNGRFTFKLEKGLSDRGRITRFIITWVTMTAASSFLLAGAVQLAERQELGENGVLLSKVFIEALLVVVSFLIQKLWVYTND